jgi:AraC-like DNA-binding protein
MPGGGTRTFLEPDHYEASPAETQIDAVILPRGKFSARLTWAELHHLLVLRCEEDFPRVAYLQLSPGPAFVTFPADSGPLPPLWSGREMAAGAIMVHSRGERLHQSTPGPFVWNVIAMDPAQLEYYGRALSGRPFSLPPDGLVLQPSPRLAAQLRRLHTQICRLAETKSKILSHSEVARAMEQGLIQSLVACLTTASVRADEYAKRHHARIMIRFEEVLAEQLGRPLSMPELCELIIVSDRTLRSCCAEFLGMSPIRYVLLRRLKEVRLTLRDADPDVVHVAEVAHCFGFTQLGSLRREIPHDLSRNPVGDSPTCSRNALRRSVNFSNFCIVGDRTAGLASGRGQGPTNRFEEPSAHFRREDQMKQLLLLGVSLIAVSACAMQQPSPPPAMAQPAAASSVGSQANTTTAFDGDYGSALAKNVTPGCPNYLTAPFGLVIRNGFAQFQGGSGLTFQGYVNPQGALAMVSQSGPTFQGQISPNFVLTGHAAGPNCAYDLTWNRITPFRY